MYGLYTAVLRAPPPHYHRKITIFRGTLYLIHQANHPELEYRGGQQSIVHLQADLKAAVDWANSHQRRWTFTLSNAGSCYFEDRNDLSCLNEVDWSAVKARHWASCKEAKQAEFLVEGHFPWELIEFVGVCSKAIYRQVNGIIGAGIH